MNKNNTEFNNPTIKKSSIRFVMALRILIVLLLTGWLVFFMILHVSAYDLPRRVDFIILFSVICFSALLGIIDTLFTRKHCRCPYCGKTWSLMKYRDFRRFPLDIFNNTNEYICYHCKAKTDIR